MGVRREDKPKGGKPVEEDANRTGWAIHICISSELYDTSQVLLRTRKVMKQGRRLCSIRAAVFQD